MTRPTGEMLTVEVHYMWHNPIEVDAPVSLLVNEGWHEVNESLGSF